MPIYHPRGISAHLGTAPLTGTITTNIAVKKGDVARQHCEDAEKQLLESTLLREESVSFPGDDYGFKLNWLGNAPFMQVQHSIMNSSLTDEPPDNEPKALSLHVKLSDKTFNSGLNGNKTNLKIEVLFNGQLVSCSFIPFHDVRSGVKSLHQIFAGTRTDFLAERPWIILPFEAPVYETDQTNSPLLAEQRWQKICQELMIEAKERGTNKQGHVQPSAEFLAALASMKMPKEVFKMHKTSEQQFGIIDVIISAGEGMKVTRGTSYLKAPTRLRDDNFSLPVSDGLPRAKLGGNADSQESLKDDIEPHQKDENRASSQKDPRLSAHPKSASIFDSPYQLSPLHSGFPFHTPLHGQGSPFGFPSLASSTKSSNPSPVFIGLSPSPLLPRASSINHPPSGSSGLHPLTAFTNCNDGTCSFLDCARVPAFMHAASPHPTVGGYAGQNIFSPIFSTGIPNLLPQTPPSFGLSQYIQTPSPLFPLASNVFPPTLLPPAGLFTVPTKPKSSKAPSPKKPIDAVREAEKLHQGRRNSLPNSMTLSCPAIPGNINHGIQDAMATPNWVTHAEEYVRNVPQVRRASSPTKRKTLPQPYTTPPTTTNRRTSEAPSSSPLSSVPQSPSSSSVKSLMAGPPPLSTCSPVPLAQDSQAQTNGSPELSLRTPNNASLPSTFSPFLETQQQLQLQLQPQNTPTAPSISPFTSPAYTSPTFSSPSRTSPLKPKPRSKRQTPIRSINTNTNTKRVTKRTRTTRYTTTTTTITPTTLSSTSRLLPKTRTPHHRSAPNATPKPISARPNRYVLDDPPLNKDCVIAYAGMQHNGEIQGQHGSVPVPVPVPVLRQVKGERQGVFKEEYVVFAGRFYVHCGGEEVGGGREEG